MKILVVGNSIALNALKTKRKSDYNVSDERISVAARPTTSILRGSKYGPSVLGQIKENPDQKVILMVEPTTLALKAMPYKLRSDSEKIVMTEFKKLSTMLVKEEQVVAIIRTDMDLPHSGQKARDNINRKLDNIYNQVNKLPNIVVLSDIITKRYLGDDGLHLKAEGNKVLLRSMDYCTLGQKSILWGILDFDCSCGHIQRL